MRYTGAALTPARDAPPRIDPWVPRQPPAQGIVAVVEDDASMRLALERLLRSAGFEVRPFDSAEALLRERSMDEVECLVVDVHLGGMSGLELQSTVRGAGSRVPFVLITGHDEAVAEEHARRTATVLLRKPFAAELLLETVTRALHGRRSAATG